MEGTGQLLSSFANERRFAHAKGHTYDNISVGKTGPDCEHTVYEYTGFNFLKWISENSAAIFLQHWGEKTFFSKLAI